MFGLFRKGFFITLLFFIALSSRGAIYVVDIIGDTDDMGVSVAGTNTFRKCIRLANANPGLDEIHFNIPAAPYTIVRTTNVSITDPVIIDGFTQPGAAPGSPLIEVSFTGNNAIHLSAGSAGSTIQGLIIYGADRGIYIENSDNNTIYGNFIGTNATATAQGPTVINWCGIEISGSDNTIIGGIAGASARNIISKNNEDGIRINNTSTGTMIIGNYIGTDITGNIALGNNQDGIDVSNNSTSTVITQNSICSNNQAGIRIGSNSDRPVITANRIGLGLDGITQLGNNTQGINIDNCFKPVIGGANPAERNYVSNNKNIGIRLFNADSVIIKGNYIGLNEAGNADHGNTEHGIWISQSDNAIIGNGVTSRNYISGNNQIGLFIELSLNPIVMDNYIGTDITGNIGIANVESGIRISNTSHNPVIVNNISCSSQNAHGIHISDSERPVITGNRVGLGLDGVTMLGNKIGINIENSFKPMIGGTTLAERNYVSNNAQLGIRLFNADSVIIKGNYVGLNEAGNADHGNNEMGIWMNQSDNPIIGGGEAGARNYISGNNQTGLHIEQSINPVVVDNFIGTDVSGNIAIGNGPNGGGVRIVNNSHNPSILNNVISANAQIGLVVENSNTPIIQSNKIGLGLDEITSMGNGQVGMRIYSCPGAQVGGLLSSERNYISENGQTGLFMERCSNAKIQGNYVGTDQTGLAAKGNGGNGIEVASCASIVIGGPGGRNIVVDNKTNGISVGGTSDHAIIQSNFVGVGADGGFNDANPRLGNGDQGIAIYGQTNYTLIGGSSLAERNICSNNGTNGGADGIRVQDPDKTIILGNYCGVDSSGTKERGNSWAGISINGSDSTTIGGPGPFEANLCSGNYHEGIFLGGATHTLIINNLVGTDITGTLPIGNDWYGIRLGNNAPNFDNIIGGSAGSANIIAFTRGLDDPDVVITENGPGVYIDDDSHRNLITFNKIFCNAGQGIDIQDPGNEGIAAPVITSTDENTATGTGNPNYTIHFYVNQSSGGSGCGCEGETYVGTTMVAADGTWSFPHNLNLDLVAGDTRSITATQTNLTSPVASTSEFSCLTIYPCDIVIAIPPSDTTVCPFQPSGFFVNATGTGISYQWQQKVPSGFTFDFVDLPGETNDTLHFPVTIASMDSAEYRVVITNSPSCIFTSDTVSIFISSTTILDQPSDTIVCSNETLDLKVVASGLNLSYQWNHNGTDIPGATSDTYNVPAVTAADEGDYFVKVTSDCGTINSETVEVVIKVTPDETLPVSDADVCSGSDAAITVSNSQTGVRYEAFIGASSVSDIVNGNGGNLNFTVASAVLQSGINKVFIRAYGCYDTTLADTAVVVVLNNPGNIIGPSQVCANANSGLIYSIDIVPGAFQYDWVATNGTITSTSSATDSISVDLGSAPTTIKVTPRTINGLTCSSASLNVDQIPDYSGLETLTVDEDSICAGNTITFTINNPDANLGYDWTVPAGATISSYNSDSTMATVKFTTIGNQMVSVQPYHSCNAGLSPLTTSVEIIQPPLADAGPDISLDVLAAVTLDGSGSSTGTLYAYEWTSTSASVIDNPGQLITQAMPQGKETDYYLTVSTLNSASCSVTDMMKVIVPVKYPELPNIFSPNGDGLHDVVEIKNIEYVPNAILYVYNQWGELIFESAPGYTIPWDGTRNGKEVPVSAYYYVLELNEGDLKPLSGNITLVR